MITVQVKIQISHPDCVRVVAKTWANQVVGNPMYMLQMKLKRLKKAMKKWNKVVFGNVDDNVIKMVDEVNIIHQIINTEGISDNLRRQDFQAQLLLVQTLLTVNEGYFWCEKARVNHFLYGDSTIIGRLCWKSVIRKSV